MRESRILEIPEGLSGMRLDAAVARVFGISRTVAAELVRSGDVSVDGTVRRKSERVAGGASVQVMLPDEPAAVQVVPIEVPDLGIVYEDDAIVVVDKPIGVAAHPSPGWDGPTVIGGLAATGHRIATSGAAERQGVVHRLDVGTSGLMVVAKTEAAYSSLKAAFRERLVDKRYRALVQGHPDPLRGTIDAPIDRHPTSAYKFAVVAGGRPSITHYETIEAFRAASLLDIRLETGRTHQIRVHMAAVRHPCVGDLQYGADPKLAARLGLSRQWLHAARLSFAHPEDGRPVTLTSPDPPDLAEALARLRADS
jgi:23S rRNA pseudouridine1911/1915/1917 synthase